MLSLFSCSNGTSTNTTAAESGLTTNEVGESTDTSDAPAIQNDEQLKFQYFATSMSVEWIQQIEEKLKTLAADNNFELLSADANRQIDTQLAQIDTAVQQNIDGAFLFIVDEGSAPAAVKKFTDAGIPVIGETLKLQDENGLPIAPVVELDAEMVGANCAEWVVNNHQTTGVNLTDQSKIGIIANTNSKYRSDLARIKGFEDKLFAAFTDIPEDNRFLADCAAEASSTDNTEASYNQVLAIVSTNPHIESWVIMSSVDNYGVGAVRAVEAAGLEDKTIIVSSGGELAVKEWDNDSAKAWRATCYYDAMDFAEVMVSGMLEIVRDGKDAKDIYSEFKNDGEEYAFYKISGEMVTPETYKEKIN